MNRIKNNFIATTYEERLKIHRKKPSLFVAFSLCYKYVKYFRLSFWFALISSMLSTLFSILVILGVSEITKVLGYFFENQNEITLIFGFSIPIGINSILIFGVVLIALYFLNAFFNFLMNFMLSSIANKIGYRLRMDLFNKIQMLKLQFFDTHESGDIMSVLTNDVLNLIIFISQNFGQLMFGFTTMFGMMIVMFLVSPYLALISLTIISLLSLYVVFMSKRSIPAFVSQQQKLGKMNGYIEEMLSGQNVVNLFKRENLIEENFEKINNELNIEAMKAQTISGLFIPFMNFLANFCVLVMTTITIVFCIKEIDFGSNIFFKKDFENSSEKVIASIAIINTFILSLRNFIQPINNIVGMIANLQQALAGCKRTSEMFLLENEDNENETLVIDKLKGSLKIKNLNFSYIEGKPVLKNINLDVKHGETIAIVGPTGSGKTTIINLLTKFYDIKDGDIYFDNKYSIKEITKSSIRNQVSIVLQDTYLFSDTVKANIRYAKRDATDEEIYDVTKVANCHDFIMQLEHGYETQLSENASELSQGQKQLIAIARAMLSESSILILDEATSNIDTRTEKVVQDAMNKLIAKKTSFIIAHRLSTIRNADKIIVLKDGQIIELGNHNELIKQKGFYYKLNNSKSHIIDEEE